jgi:hypothetical protein
VAGRRQLPVADQARQPNASAFEFDRKGANRALGRLDGLTAILPDTDLFLYIYVRKEALLSSQIEGTQQSSLSDLLLLRVKKCPGFHSLTSRTCLTTSPPCSTALQVCVEGSRSACVCYAKSTESCLVRGAEVRKHLMNLAGRRIGSVVPAQVMQSLFHRLPDQVMPGLDALEKFLHDQPEPTSVLSKQHSRRFSSKPSIRFWTAMAAWGDCSSRSCSARKAHSVSRFCISAFISRCTGRTIMIGLSECVTKAIGKDG